ncbi:Kelch repeat-containing protein [Winogradskyella flava]|uniref:T9SS type A sorting domain-containing protein n=1 Tax=Winogradskyella flava TaxID=1884876 RepID=A0A842IT09_9FLAO|nr:kelch repeat-containing protein [Winogradskyella flava]MBC2846150.1 T9SS type A sorting domain-containing protein [Winogradskyella flava]
MKHLYTFIFFCFFIGIHANCQSINFSDAADMPAAKSATSSANDGSNIYVANGFSIAGGFTSDVFKYDITNNSWSVLTNATIGKRFGSAAIVGNNLFIFNGYTPGNSFNDALEIVDLATGVVVNPGLVNPQPAAGAGVSVEGNIIYSFGGNTGSGFSNKLYAVNTSALTITELAPMPIAAETKGEVVNGKLYIIGGFNGSTSDKIHVYDISTNTWTDEYTLPQTLSANATAVVGDRIYVLGDFSDQNFTGYFDTSTNTFTETTSNLVNRRHASAEGVNGELYVMGGNTTSSGTSAIASTQMASITLSTEDYNEELFSMYPNPAIDYVSFSKQVEELTLLSLTGRIVKEASNITTMDINDLQKGIYILKLKDQGNSQIIKLVKH